MSSEADAPFNPHPFIDIRASFGNLGAIPNSSAEFVQEQKMCVVRALATAAEQLLGIHVTVPMKIMEARLAAMDHIKLEYHKTYTRYKNGPTLPNQKKFRPLSDNLYAPIEKISYN